MGTQIGESFLRRLAAGGGVGDQADRMTTRDLAFRHVQHMTKQAAHWGPKHMYNA
jgi:hypothetical protein